MECEASTDAEVHKAQERFRIEMLKAAKRVRDMADPVKQEMLANTPPHLLNK